MKTNRKTFSRQQEQAIIHRLISDWEKGVEVTKSMNLTPCNLNQFVRDESNMSEIINSIDPNETMRLTKKSQSRILNSVEAQYEVQNINW